VGYIDQFDDLVRESDRGRAIRNTRTIAVFDDGLVVCPVSVYGSARPGGLWRQRRAPGPAPARNRDGGENEVKRTITLLGDEASARELAEAWPKAAVIPLDVIDSVVLTRPQQVSRLAVREQKTGTDTADSVFLGNLDPARVRSVLGPLLGDRLAVEIPRG
jgi:hypothetical protein